MHQFLKFIYFGIILYMFWTVFPSIIRSSRLYIQQQVYGTGSISFPLASRQQYLFDIYNVVQIWPGLIFFLTIIAKHVLAHVSLQRTPLPSQHIFSNVLEASWCPFKKRLVVGGVSTPEQSGWWRRPQTACLASLIWALRTGRNQLGPNRDCTADVSEGSISISAGFPLLFWPYGGVHCLEVRLPAFHLSSAWIGSFPSRLLPGGLSNKLHWLFWHLSESLHG